MNFSKNILTLIAFCASSSLFAQFQGEVYKQDTTVKAIAYSVEKKIAFSGGFNNPQFAMGDLNNDGTQDLVVFEKGCSEIKTFINYGTAGNPNYVYSPKYQKNFPESNYGQRNVNGFLKLEDYNCDNVPDLIHRGFAGLSVYKGYYANNELHFTYYKDLFYSPLTLNNEDFEFNIFPPTGWAQNGVGWSRQTTGTNPTVTPQSGNAMARFNSANLAAGTTALLVSRRFRISYNFGNNGSVSFWMYRDNNFSNVGDSLSVYISHNNSLTNATYINRVARSIAINQPDTKPSAGWYQYSFPIPANFISDTLYLIFKGTSQGGYNIFVDNINWITSSIYGDVNAYVEPGGDIPGIADVDGDGDLDFFAFNIGGGHVDFYKNYRVEDGLPCDSIRINLKDGCWGRTYQGFTMEQTLGVNCPGSQPIIPPAKTTHTGNTICMLDYDGDGDYDYLNGGVSYGYIQLLKNGKADYNYPRDTMISQDTAWQSNGHVYYTPQFPSAFWLDIDQDGKKDILISPNAESASENYKSITYYKNTGTTSSPVYTYQSDSFLVDNTIDMGTGSYPMLYDYDKDGKPDLFIGADGFFQSNGTLRARISYYQNTSTPGNPSFTLMDNDFLGIYALNIRGAYPAVGDLDNDGKDDLVIGHSDGTISFYKNTAVTNNVQPQWQLNQNILKDANNNNIDSVENASPFIYDINQDGKKDLILGGMSGWLYYYENTGTANQLSLQYQTNKLGLVKADPINTLSAFSTPFIGRMDNSPNDYLLIGSNSGVIYRFTGFQNGNTTAPYQRIDSAYSFINSNLGMFSGYRSVPAIADIDGDGKYEMVLGGSLGGVKIYKQSMTVSVDEITGDNNNNVTIYPNPAKDAVFINWGKNFAQNQVTITIYSITGQKQVQKIIASSENNAEISTGNIASGTYLCEIASGNNRRMLKLVILK